MELLNAEVFTANGIESMGMPGDIIWITKTSEVFVDCDELLEILEIV